MQMSSILKLQENPPAAHVYPKYSGDAGPLTLGMNLESIKMMINREATIPTLTPVE